jgi:hypothetical protein
MKKLSRVRSIRKEFCSLREELLNDFLDPFMRNVDFSRGIAVSGYIVGSVL